MDQSNALITENVNMDEENVELLVSTPLNSNLDMDMAVLTPRNVNVENENGELEIINDEVSSTPKMPSKVKYVQVGHGKIRRKLDRAKATRRRLFPANASLDPRNFDGPGWECLAIGEADAGRFYKAIRIKGIFLLLNILVEQLQFNYPEERIKAIFSKMVDCLQQTVRQKGFKPQHYIVGLNSELMESSKNLHVHQIDEDIADILLNWFIKIDQSGMLKHHKDSLTLQSFEIDILAIELWNGGRHQIKMGKKKQKRHPGTGGPIRFRHNINLDAIMEINNNDNYCLFRSFEILRHRATMIKQHFYKYKNNEKRQSKDVRNLMLECGIPRNLKSYSIEEWGEKIWEYYQAKHPNQFRLFAFPEIGELKKGNKKNKCRRQSNTFVDFEADESGEEAENSDFEEEESAFDREFIDNVIEMGENEDLPPNPYLNSGFFERIEQPNSPPLDQPCSSNSLTDRQILEKVWAQSEEQMRAQGIIPWDEQEAREEEEIRRKSVEEEERKKKRVERRNKREIVTYVYAHYGQKYDHVFSMYELFQMGFCPKVIMQGKRFYQIQVRRRGVVTPTIFRDTYHLIPIKLEAFVATFKLEIPGVEGKQYFPYLFNKLENLGKKLNHLPSIYYYCRNGMMRKKAEKLDTWHEENKNNSFELNEELAAYCKSDVEILAHGFVKMREIFMQATGLDITRSITSSGAAMNFFRTFVPENLLALTPEMGYEKRDRSSGLARKYLKWLEYSLKIKIQNADTPEGEKKIGKWKLDGYIERDEEDGGPIAIEINGCFWHACPRCNKGIREEHFLGRKNVGEIWKKDLEKHQEIRQTMHLWVIWECQIRNEMQENPEMEAFMDNLEDTGPIKLRDAFVGGRTGPEWLIANAPADQSREAINNANPDEPHTTIKVKDFKSLYPSVNFDSEYPIGHPWAKINEGAAVDVNWTKPEDIPYFEQLLQVFVVPPRHVDIPVLPIKYVGRKETRLLFSLCKACARANRDGLYDPGYSCPHFEDAERGHQGTYTKPELEKALEAGYRVTKHYRSYVWDEDIAKDYSSDLFKPYIQAIMCLKYKAEGWPSSITSLPEEEQEMAKIEYIIEAAQRYGIEFTIEDVQNNPGLKFIAKLLLNSLWGRFALRNRLSMTVYASDDLTIAKYLNDKKIKIERFEQVTEKIWMIVYKTKKEYVREHGCSNLILALWTTSMARIKLLEAMQKVMKRPDARILYYDTDSIFYQYDTELGDPIEDGRHLGELTDQYPDHIITEYICLAPKLYSLKMLNKKTGEVEYETKAKGFTLDCENADVLNHETMKAQLMEFLQGEQVNPIECHYPYNNFRVTKKCEIFTVPIVKKARPIINKGVVRPDGRVLPFGWSDYADPKNRGNYDNWMNEPNNAHRLENSRYEKN